MAEWAASARCLRMRKVGAEESFECVTAAPMALPYMNRPELCAPCRLYAASAE